MIQIHFVTNKQDTISTGKPTLKGDHICLRCPAPRPTLPPSPPTPAPVRYPCKTKKVRIESTTDKALQFFEVQALSYPNASNVALKSLQANATQSSNFKQNTAAEKAIDGNMATYSQTNEGAGSWWQVELKDVNDLSAVKVLNRNCGGGGSSDLNGCLCSLSNAELQLYDSQGQLFATRVFGNTCGQLLLVEEFLSCPRATVPLGRTAETQQLPMPTPAPTIASKGLKVAKGLRNGN
jgi:hypothetical protein